MYLRTTQRKNADGSIVRYFQLAHNVRDPDSGRASAEILYNFGRADELDREQLVRLCRSIARVCGVEVRDPLSTEAAAAGAGQLPDGVELLRTVELGTLLLIEGLWDKLGLRSTLERIAKQSGLTVPYERALFAMVANRLCEPHSKLGVWERWLPEAYLPSCWDLKLEQFYGAMDLLAEHAEEVEEMVFFRTADLFNVEVDLIFYDTTTAEFCIDFEDEDQDEEEPALRRWGRNKEGGNSVQVVVALALTRDGLPVRSWVFPGNTADVSTIETIRRDLRAWKLARCVLVGDAGMNSDENRAELARACGKYVLAIRGDVKEVREEVLSRPGRYREVSENLKVKEVVVGDGEKRRRYVLCYNPAEAERQKKRRAEVLSDLHELLLSHKSRNVRAKWTAAVRASQRTGPYLSVSSSGELYVDANKIEAAEKLDGKWVVMTNDDSLPTEEVATSYRAMAIIERCFRSLKSAQIEIRPMFHRANRRIEAHVKICMLSLLIQRIAERECKRPWPRLHESLRKLQATELKADGKQFFRSNSIPEGVAEIFRTLKIQLPKPVLSIS
jgi:transposase